jgi:hypothetical protein
MAFRGTASWKNVLADINFLSHKVGANAQSNA